jgi:ethanolamine utilization protein EutN
MRISEVIGNVTLSKCHPSLEAARWLLAVPLTAAGLGGDPAGRGEPFIVYDEIGAGDDCFIAVSDGAEASAPFYPKVKPIDAYNAAILDNIEIESGLSTSP